MPVRRLLLLALLLSACAKKPAPPIIVISIDTLRADHVSAYGATSVRTPALDALAADSTLYRNAWSNCPLTLPSHLSIFTGLLPPEHGVRDNSGYRFDSSAHPTVASLLHAHGYHTGAAVSAYVLRESTGVNAGFDDYDDSIGLVDGAPLGALQRDGRKTEAVAEAWIDAHRDGPFFYFLHLYEPHSPYAPTYDADVASADAIVGRFLAHLKASGVYDRAAIVLLSDHGEGLMDHGEQEHGVFLYREALHVPLLLKLPGQAGRGASDSPAELTDVAPTLLELAGIEAPRAMHGLSLLHAPDPHRLLYAESFYPRIHLGWSELRAALRGRFHAIDAPAGELYDVAADPAERKNLAADERRAFNELHEATQRLGGSFAAPERVDPEEAKKLAALGYVSAGSDTGGPLPDPKMVIGQLELLRSVAALSDRGEHPAAIAALEKLLATNPRWSDVREQLGEEYEKLDDFTNAVRVYRDGITLTPRLAGSFALAAGFSLLELRQLDDAAAHAAIALAAHESGAHLLLGEIALARNDLDGATKEERAAELEGTEKTQALFLAARVASARKDYPHTLDLLDAVEREQAATGSSLPERFHYVAADALARSGRGAEAEREFRRAIEADPHDDRAYADLALLQMIGGRKSDAGATLERLATVHPKRAVLLDVAKQLEAFGDREGAAVWRARARVAK